MFLDHDVLSHYMIKGKKKRSVLLTMFENCKDFVVPSRTKRFWSKSLCKIFVLRSGT